MTDNLDLARRVVACKHWRWLPGMRLVGFDDNDCARICTIKSDDCIGVSRESGALKSYDGEAWPELSDPATLGCLLALVRESYAPKPVWTEADTRSHGDVPDEWTVHTFDGCYASAQIAHGATEVAALIAALEAAP